MTAPITRSVCYSQASVILGNAMQKLLNRDPREAAEAAHVPGGLTVDELEKRIRELHSSHDSHQLQTA